MDPNSKRFEPGFFRHPKENHCKLVSMVLFLAPATPLPWLTFIHAHLESMIVCDFFTKDVFTAGGRKTAYVLIFIHLGSRKVYCSAPIYYPDSA